MILLDTHVLLWVTEDSKRLGAKARKRIEEETGDIHLSAMSFWEIAMLVNKQRIALSMPQAQWRERLLGSGGFRIVPVDAAIASDAGSLTDIHGDPCDRILIATARSLGCPILTVDGPVLAYAAKGHVEALDAGR